MIQNKTKQGYRFFWSACIYHFRAVTKTLTQSLPYACRSFLSSEKAHPLSFEKRCALFVCVWCCQVNSLSFTMYACRAAISCSMTLFFCRCRVTGSLLAVAVAVPVPLLPALRLLLPLQEQPFAACFLPTLLSAPGHKSFYIPCNTFGWCMHTSLYYKHRQWQRHTADSVLFLWIFFYILL